MPFVSVQVSGLWQYWQRNMHAVVHATSANARAVDGRAGREGMQEAEVAGLAAPVLTSVSGTSVAQMDPQLERDSALRADVAAGVGADTVSCHSPWKVRLITSICCSRVSRTKLTA